MSFLELVLFLAWKGRGEKALRSDNVGANAWLIPFSVTTLSLTH